MIAKMKKRVGYLALIIVKQSKCNPEIPSEPPQPSYLPYQTLSYCKHSDFTQGFFFILKKFCFIKFILIVIRKSFCFRHMTGVSRYLGPWAIAHFAAIIDERKFNTLSLVCLRSIVTAYFHLATPQSFIDVTNFIVVL